jgi:Outer membrane protein beta-barrel domain
MKYVMNFKTRLFSVSFFMALLLAGTLSVSAQEQAPDSDVLKPTFGIKGGLNLSNFYVDDVKDKNIKSDIHAGLFLKLPVAKGFSIQPELLYSAKGAQISYDAGVFGSGKYNFNLNYVELPVLAVFNLTKNFNIHAGAYAAYLASANIKQVKDNADDNTIASFNEDDFNRFDYGLVGGIGFDINKFLIGARYNYGLGEVGKSDELISTGFRNSKNSVISAYIGFAF